MKITTILKQRNRGVSFEFFPPKSEAGKKSLVTTVRSLKESNPLYISMTCGARGTTQERTKEAVYTLLQEKELEIMAHLTCIGARKSSIESILNEYKEKGIENIMALRGDVPQDVSDFDFSAQDFRYARDLVTFIKKYGHFCIGVAVYPEGHIEMSSLEEDLEYTKQKIDAGADFAVTQMFFDNSHYYALLDRMKKKGITIPVLPGILPLTDVAKVKQFASVCRTTIPQNIEEEMARFSGKPLEMEKMGIEFTIRQCQDLIKKGVEQIHFFTLNKSKTIKAILDAI
ncbi:MAG: methylenetetrahydrofolate reductase [NAD(P)H] [Candidatus Omnitrophota bacterium]|nr:MAG: methylenetetrahydrofolate reductase [NAD(P)H] [Candidatus Omnitrophota bacterium]